jgi:gluconokinase
VNALHAAPPIVVMGVSGSGKTTVAAALADRFDAVFVDADDLHAPAAVAKMAAGTPLTDADRRPWLERVSARIAADTHNGTRSVVACSALRRSYRDLIREHSDIDVFFVQLDGTAELLGARLDGRNGHFMPSALLTSQLAILEPLEPDEVGIIVDIDLPASELVNRIAGHLTEAVS